nr:zinc finger, CCHC-type [Tanacetum cinerariifolium]
INDYKLTLCNEEFASEQEGANVERTRPGCNGHGCSHNLPDVGRKFFHWKDMTTKFDKLVEFEGQDFRRWQKKMHFLLTTLKVVYVLSTPSPEWHEDETLETTRKRMKWENDDYICHGHILNVIAIV